MRKLAGNMITPPYPTAPDDLIGAVIIIMTYKTNLIHSHLIPTTGTCNMTLIQLV